MLIVEKINEDFLKISFKYYPDYIDRIKGIGGIFNANDKSWNLNINSIDKLEDTFKGELYFKTPLWEIKNEAPPKYENLYKFDNNVDIDSLSFKLSPFNYQKFGIKFLVDRLETLNMAFICDDMGLGKTAQAIGTIKYLSMNDKVKNIVIICKKSIKSQWKEEIQKFIDFDGDIYVADSTKNKREKTYEAIKNNPNKTILIANYHLLLKDADLVKSDFIIFDEVHVAKSYNKEINKACRKVTKKAKYCLFMTGTPIMSQPDDMFGIISIKDKKYFGTFSQFKNRYLVEYFNGSYNSLVGYKNLDELRDKMQHLILRRTSNEVDIELPETVSTNLYCDIDKLQTNATIAVEEKVEDIQSKLETIESKYKKTDKENKEALRKLMEDKAKLEAQLKGFIAAKQAIANSPSLFNYSKSKMMKLMFKDYIPPNSYVSNKMKTLLELVEDIKENDRKVIIFTKYETVCQYVRDLFTKNKINSVVYTGKMNDEDREKSISNFKNNNDITAIIGTDSLAEGVNLQLANTVINIDLAYNQAINQQRIGRARRAGSKYKTVFVYNLITKDSIDENIYKKVIETKNSFDSLISVNKEQSKLLRELSN